MHRLAHLIADGLLRSREERHGVKKLCDSRVRVLVTGAEHYFEAMTEHIPLLLRSCTLLRVECLFVIL